MDDDLTPSTGLQHWARQYRQFAAQECPNDPLYVALCLIVADSPELLALMAHVRAQQQARPNLLLAALHERVLAGVPHALAAYYPSVGGERAPDAELSDALHRFVRAERPRLLEHLRLRSTQTNEIGRCAVLWPALSAIAAQTARQDLALFDFGCSAGLNLGVDAYRYAYGHFQLGAPAAPERPTVACQWRSAAEPPRTPWRLQARLGVDLAPVDVQDEAAVRWLRACLWPHDRARARRLDQALAQARAARHPVQQADQGLLRLAEWLEALPAGVQPVLFNSWVLAYFDAPALAAHRAEVEGLMHRHGLLWLSAETADLRPAGLALPPAPEGESADSATLWTLQWAEQGHLRQRALAWSHAHGHWLHSLDGMG
ncbi:DUF2332 domain-containing protein [Roseateles sp.]|uniref:DUF2332 domain-containing protein n=1 Tax=Roseateles sp. TaxID=1971397 RepID=UPI003D132645